MRKLQLLKKTFLVVAGLLVGSSAWADNVYTILYGTATYTGEAITGVTPQTDFTANDGTVVSNYSHEDGNGNTEAMPVTGSVLASETSFTKSFPKAATKGTVHFEANYTTTTNGQETFKVVDSNGIEIFGTTDAGFSNGNATKNWGFCNGVALGTGWFRIARSAHNRIVLDINLSSKVVSYTVLISSGNGSYTTLNGTYNLPDAVKDVAGLTATKQTYYAYMDYVSFYNVYDNSVIEAPYTINYNYNETTIKTTTGSMSIGSTITAENPITIDGVRYFAAESATMSKTIEDGENVLNVTLRLANTYNYEVNAVDGSDNILKALSSGSITEGDGAVSVSYPRYILSGTTLYASGSGTVSYKTSFTPDEDNYVKTITYNSGTVSDVVFYTEGEDVAGVTVGNNADRASKGQMGHTGSIDTYKDATTLSPGKYKIYMRGQNGNSTGRNFNFKVGESVVFTGTFANGTNTDLNSEEFTIYDNSTLSFASEGSSASGIDYFYVVKTGALPLNSPTITRTGTNTYTITATSTTYGSVTVDPSDQTIHWTIKGGEEQIQNGPDAYLENVDGDIVYWTTDNNSKFGESGKVTETYFVPKVTITDAGWATFYTDLALDFSGLSDKFKAYTATYDGSTVTLSKVSDVPGGTGVVLKGKAGTHEVPVIAASNTAKGHLQGSTTEDLEYAAIANDNYDYYMLAWNDQTKKAQFMLLNEGSIDAGKAYLKIEKEAQGETQNRALAVVFEGEGITTGIQSVGELKAGNDAIYSLSGQRVSQPSRGLFIVNGKKVIK